MAPAVGQTLQDIILQSLLPPILLPVHLKQHLVSQQVRLRLAGKLFRLACFVDLTRYDQFFDGKWQLKEFSRRSSRRRTVGICGGFSVGCDIYSLYGFVGRHSFGTCSLLDISFYLIGTVH